MHSNEVVFEGVTEEPIFMNLSLPLNLLCPKLNQNTCVPLFRSKPRYLRTNQSKLTVNNYRRVPYNRLTIYPNG